MPPLEKIKAYLFTTPADPSIGTSETFHFYIPWLIVCLLGLLIPIYYFAEGRKRFVKSNPLLKYMYDSVMNRTITMALIGLFLIACRYLVDFLFLSWRVWRYGWALACVILIGYAIYYQFRIYPRQALAYEEHLRKRTYLPKPKPKTAMPARLSRRRARRS